MLQKPALFLSFFLLLNVPGRAQVNGYTGTWEAKGLISAKDTLNIRLQISESEKYILYPATLTVITDSFSGKYEMLLVKKNSRELGISRNKFSRAELPAISSSHTMLAGTFDHSRNLKGVPTLTFQPIIISQATLADTGSDKLKDILYNLPRFFKEQKLVLNKINDIGWAGEFRERMLDPSLSATYFGLQDTIMVQQRSGKLILINDKKSGDDIVSIGLNGRIVIDQRSVSKKKQEEEILLDTGMNIITLFADNFSKGQPNRTSFLFDFGGEKIRAGFNNRPDSAATFIVLKIYSSTDKLYEKRFPVYNGDAYLPVQPGERLITSLLTKSAMVQLAVWDDAEEDGDSVSINIDGKWITQGLRVLNKAQFIPVTLNAGTNTIIFLADNAGSIPPNTSMLEIIDGPKRKAYSIKTAVDTRNLLRIFYEK